MYLHYKLLKHSLSQTLAMIVFHAWYCSKPAISKVMSLASAPVASANCTKYKGSVETV